MRRNRQNYGNRRIKDNNCNLHTHSATQLLGYILSCNNTASNISQPPNNTAAAIQALIISANAKGLLLWMVDSADLKYLYEQSLEFG
jgi:hypothetical protein